MCILDMNTSTKFFITSCLLNEEAVAHDTYMYSLNPRPVRACQAMTSKVFPTTYHYIFSFVLVARLIAQLNRSPFRLRKTSLASYLLFSFIFCASSSGACLVGAGS